MLLLQSLTRTVWEATSLDAALRELLQAICQSTGWPVGLAWLPQDGELRLAEAQHGVEAFPVYHRVSARLRLKVGQDCAGWCWESRNPIWVKDVDQRGFFKRREAATHCGLRTGIWIPVIANGEVAAVLEFMTPESLAEDRCQVGLLNTIAGQLGAMLGRKHEEESLRRNRDELAAANASLGKDLHRHQEMLVKITHELRTPLAGILSMSEALRDETYGPVSTDQRESLRNVEETGKHLLELVNDLLDVCRHASGESMVDPTPTRVYDVCRSALDIVAPIAKKRRQQLEYRCDCEDLTVQWDARRVRQVLVNLLSNAIKFTAEGGKLGLRLSSLPDQGLLRLAVWDQGVGMTSEQKERLFRPFASANVSVDWEYGSSGVGLYLAKQLTEAHNGTMRVQSQTGQGTEFTLDFPLDAEAQPVAQTPATVSHRVLVVDDSPIQRMLLTDHLRKRGYEVQQASDGQEAVHAAQRFEPDFVLMDYHLPGQHGADAVRCIRKFNDRAVIWVMSGVASAEAREMVLTAGASGYRQKPANLEELRRFLDAHLPTKLKPAS